jgi:hypothetical protein
LTTNPRSPCARLVAEHHYHRLAQDVERPHEVDLEGLPETPNGTVIGASESTEGKAEVSVPCSMSKSMRRRAPPIANTWSYISCEFTIAEIAPVNPP